MSIATEFEEELAKCVAWLDRENAAEKLQHHQSYLNALQLPHAEHIPEALRKMFFDFVDSKHIHVKLNIAQMRKSKHFSALLDNYIAYPEQRRFYKNVLEMFKKIDQHYGSYVLIGASLWSFRSACQDILITERLELFLQQHRSEIPVLTQQQLAQLMGKVPREPPLLAMSYGTSESQAEVLNSMPAEQVSDLLYWLIQLLALSHYKNLTDSLGSSRTDLQDCLVFPLRAAITAEHPALLEERNFMRLVVDFDSLLLLIRMPKFIQLLAKYTPQKAKKKQLSPALQAALLELNFTQFSSFGIFPGKQLEKYQQKIHDTVHAYQLSEKASQSEQSQESFDLTNYQLPWSDSCATVGAFIRQDQSKVAWSAILQQEFDQLNASDKRVWLAFWQHVEAASTSKPTQKWLKQAEVIWQQPQIHQHYLQQLKHWWTLIEKHSNNQTRPLDSKNESSLRAVLWFSQFQHKDEDQLLNLLTHMAEYCYRKIFAVGATSAVIGGVVLNLLAQRGLAGLAKLSFLQKKVRYELGQKVIRKALDQAATQNQLTVAELRELVAEDFALQAGHGQYIDCADVQLQLQCMRDHRCEVLVWQDGKLVDQPTKTLQKHPDYKALKLQASQISRHLLVHTQNFEQALWQQRCWNYAFWQQHIISHGILGWLASRLIWCLTLDDGSEHCAMYQDEQWLDAQQQPCVLNHHIVSLHLWHPVTASSAEVQAWREFLMEKQIVQGCKQAFREIYLANLAEHNEQHSLRFAYHFLQQSKFKAIANSRGWHYDIQGGWDNFSFPGRYFASEDLVVHLEIALPEHNQLLNEHGVYAYIKTQQLSFEKQGVLLNLAEVPLIIFSEALRDIDYMVQGCSIGMDPNLDLEHFPDEMKQYYFQRYGNSSSQVVAARQSSLDLILSKLDIAAQCQIDARFVYVAGQLHRYKIHLATAQVFISENDQALCILPEKKLNQISVEHLFLPFDDDAMLSLILSQVLLLAQDSQIKDPLIQAQIQVA